MLFSATCSTAWRRTAWTVVSAIVVAAVLSTAGEVDAQTTPSVVSVKDFGAVGNGMADDSDAIRAAVVAAKGKQAPLFFPPGDYLVTKSIDLTGPPEGWSVHGAGQRLSRIVGRLREGLPVLDFSGAGAVEVADLTVQGHRDGLQSAGILLARTSPSLRGDEVVLNRIMVTGTFAKVALANVSSDLMTITHSTFDGPTGIVIGVTDVLNVGSRYSAFATVTGNTLHTIIGGTVAARSGACIDYRDGSALTVLGTFMSIQGTATAGIRVSGVGGKTLYVYDARTESPGSAPRTHSVNFEAPSSGGYISGNYHVRGGPYINNRAGLGDYDLQIHMSDSSLPYIGGGGSLRNSIVRNLQGAPGEISDDSGGNVILQQGGRPWIVSPRHANIIMTPDVTTIGPVAIGGGAPIRRQISGTILWDPPPMADGSTQTMRVHVDGARRGDVTAVGFSAVDSGGWQISAQVTEVDWVTVTLTNRTGRAADLSSGTLRVDVWQH